MREVLQRTNRFAISGAPLLAILLVILVAADLYTFDHANRIVALVCYSVVFLWGLICYRGAIRTSLDEGYWLAASWLPFTAVSYFIGPLPASVCIILAAILAVGTAIEFVARDDADIRKLINDFRTPRRQSP